MKKIPESINEHSEEFRRLRKRVRELESTEADLKRQIEALRISGGKYREIVEKTREAIFVIQDETIVYFNRSGFPNIRYRSDEIMNKSLFGLIHPDDRERVADNYFRRIRGEEVPSRYSYRVVGRDGGIHWVEIHASLINWEGRPATLNLMLNITRRRQVEEKLRASESKYRLLAEKINDVVWMADLNLRTFYHSPSIEKVLGFTPEERQSMSVEEILTPSSRSLVRDEMAEEMILEREGTADPDRQRLIELEFYHKEGSTRWLECLITGIRDDQGVLTGIHGVSRDITDRRKAEEQRRASLEALRESEERYREIVDNIPESYYEVDMAGNLTFYNIAAMMHLGYDDRGLKGMNFRKFMAPEDVEEVSAVYNKIFTTGEPVKNIEYTLLDRNGNRVSADASASLKRDVDGRPVGFRGVIHDITERKRIEEERKRTLAALRESEAKYRLVVENASDVIWTFDLGTMSYDYVSPSVERIYGYPHKTTMHNGMDELYTSDSRRLIWKNFGKLRNGLIPDDHLVMEAEHYTADGGTLWIEISATTIKDASGTVTGFSGVSRDITERKRLEAEREQRLNLERRLLRAQKLESIGTLAGGIAHDFNNLLMGIQGYTSLMLLDLEPSHPHHERLRHIEEQVAGGAALTGQLLGFARGGRYEVRPASLTEIIEQTAAMFGRTKKEVTVHCRFAPDLWTVEVDRTQMEQVFMNLFVNAWQAMTGGGDLYLDTENVILDEMRVRPVDLTPGRYVKASVTDTGMGMDERTRERIFDPFFSTKGMGRGTGLGLATVYGIIRGHRGMINVYSEPGRGTTFSLYLPASEKAIEEESPDPSAAAIHRGAGTILLVDDEAMVLEVSRELLESLGYRVHTAAGGREAVAFYEEKGREIDLVILDMIMPGLSGGETFDRLRAIDSGARIILSSGYSLNGEAKTIMDRGCDGFLQKPFQLAQLSQKVRDVLKNINPDE